MVSHINSACPNFNSRNPNFLCIKRFNIPILLGENLQVKCCKWEFFYVAALHRQNILKSLEGIAGSQGLFGLDPTFF